MAAPAISCTCEAWWAVTDSNRRHPACKAGALPTELTARRRRYRPARHSVQARWRAATPSGFRASKLCRIHGRRDDITVVPRVPRRESVEGRPAALGSQKLPESQKRPRRVASGEPASFSSRDAGSGLTARTIIDDLLAFSALRPFWGNGKRKREQRAARHSGPSRCGALALAGCLTSRVASKTNGAPHGTPLKLSAFSRFNAPSDREALPRPRVFPPQPVPAWLCSRPTRLARARASAHAQALRPCATPG